MLGFITSRIKNTLNNPMLNNPMVQTAIAGGITAGTGIPITPLHVRSALTVYNKMIGKGHKMIGKGQHYSIVVLQNDRILNSELFNDKELALKKLKNDINKLLPKKTKLHIKIIDSFLCIYSKGSMLIVLSGFTKEDNLSLKTIIKSKYNKNKTKH